MASPLATLALALALLTLAAARGDVSSLYEKYNQAKSTAPAKPTIIKSVVAVAKGSHPSKDLFFAPLPGQTGVDFHPQLRAGASNDTEFTYYSWHIHVYFFHEDTYVTDQALALRDAFIKKFNLATCDDGCFMGGWMDSCTQGMCVWDPVYGVDGPHPYGNWGAYMPNEYFLEAISWLSANHGDFDVLFHPNTGYMVGDHDQNKRAIWIKQMVPLDLDFLKWMQCKWFTCSDEVSRAAALA